ncbi:MAG TPA: WecB/TagA/CpsF family glycosyltransferase [Mycobacteriales bacterium]|nr:WecB/TagA/CpsF family glycosyltransferase [Mycobacteriales bacterium]
MTIAEGVLPYQLHPQPECLPPHLAGRVSPRTDLPAQRVAALSTADLYGIDFTAATEQQVIDHVVEQATAGVGGRVATINLDILRQLCADRQQMRLLDGVDLCVPDGMPLLWAARLRGRRLPERVTGADLVWSLSAGAASAGLRVYFLGAPDGVAARAAANISAACPGLAVAGTYAPPFGCEKDEAELTDISSRLLAAQPNIVFCAFGFPKQEELMRRLSATLPNTWFVACGGALSMAAGDLKRAPQWAQRAGLEWVFRLAREPFRLARRYLVHDVPFAVRLIAGSLLTAR